jgi:hypothetical protein
MAARPVCWQAGWARKLRVQYPATIWETTMTLAWIAERLHMEAPGQVACLLNRNNQEAGGSENQLF